MILNNVEKYSVEGDDFGGVQSKIDEKDFSKLYTILSGLYKNIYESIIREYASNAWDSHKDAGCENKPIMIKLDSDELIIQDYGIGMTSDTLENVYFNFLNSTKSDSNDFLGAFGLGSKSALSYTHTMFVESIKDGMLNKYMFSKESTGIPEYTLLVQEETDAGNGTKITIPLKQGDAIYFSRAIVSQLTYFPNVYVIDDITPFNNDYKLYEGKNFIATDANTNNITKICLGCVNYPIDWDELGFSNPLRIPVALKFNIGDLPVIPSRESIEYNKGVADIIKKKLDAACDEITKIYEKEGSLEYDNLKQYIDYLNSTNSISRKVELTKDFAIDVPTNSLNLKKATLKGTNNHVSIVNNIGVDYRYSHKTLSDSGRLVSSHRSGEISYNILTSTVYNFVLYNHDEDIANTRKNLYIRETQGRVVFIRKRKPTLSAYKKTILVGVPKKRWREVIKIHQHYAEQYVSDHVKKYSDLNYPLSWWRDRLRRNRTSPFITRLRDLRDKTISIGVPTFFTYHYKFANEDIKLSELRKRRWIVYGIKGHDDDNLIALFTNFRNVYDIYSIMTVAKNNEPLMDSLPNAISIEELLKSKHRQLIRIATSAKVEELISQKNTWLSEWGNDVYKLINSDIHEKSIKVREYLIENSLATTGRDELLEMINEFITDADLIDTELIKYAVEVKKYCDYMDDIQKDFKTGELCMPDSIDDYKRIKRLTSIMKSEGIRVNADWYVKDEFNSVLKLISDDTEETN